MKVIETERLILRTWQKEDAESYFQINQDPEVIEFLPRSLTMQEVAEQRASKSGVYEGKILNTERSEFQFLRNAGLQYISP